MSRSQQAFLIRTKFHRPPVTADYVNRDVLDATLDAGVELPLTIVTAPAGYGKSTLVSHCQRPDSGRTVSFKEALQ